MSGFKELTSQEPKWKDAQKTREELLLVDDCDDGRDNYGLKWIKKWWNLINTPSRLEQKAFQILTGF